MACPRGLSGFVGEVTVERRPADAEVFGHVACGVPVGFHPSCGRDVGRVGDFLPPPEFGALAREAARLRAVRSLTSSRSNPAMLARTPITVRPATVDESMPSVVEIRVTP